MTYADLITQLQALTPSQLSCAVTVYVINDEYIAACALTFPDTDVLDPGHPVIALCD